MREVFGLLLTGFALLVVISFFAWAIWRALKRIENPGILVCKLVVTCFLLCVVIFVLFPTISKFDMVSAASIPHLAAIAVIIGIIWAPSWASMLVSPLTGMIDGGVADGEVTPQYSIAETRRARGQFREAITVLREELEKFPNDLRLQLMMAEIQAEHLDDLQGAEAVILRICQQKHSPANVSSAFQKLADWHLKIGKDPDSARQTLERIIEAFPDSQFAQGAAQRIAHLSSADQLMEQDDVRPIKLKEYERDLGLKLRDGPQGKAPPKLTAPRICWTTCNNIHWTPQFVKNSLGYMRNSISASIWQWSNWRN